MTFAENAKHDRFLRLYLELEGALRGFVRSLVPTREDAREVMQETAAVLWRKFDEGADAEEFRRWAFGVARFEALAFVRDRARDRHVFGDEVLEMLARQAEHESAHDDAEARALELCLQKLPQAQREMLEAAYAPGTRMDELAKVLGRSAMALYKSLHRIRMTLVDCTRLVLKQEAQ